MDRGSGMARSALAYAQYGWRVFPCHTIRDEHCTCGSPSCERAGKHPLTQHGLHDATRDRRRIEKWWTATPDANIGIATGDGLVVLDLDGPDGITTWDVLTIDQAAPFTLVAATGRQDGGLHLYYAVPEPLPNTRWKLGLKIDTRGDGGYVLAPPSLHASGRRYEWRNKRHPAPLPEWALAMLRPRLATPEAPPRISTSSTPYAEGVLRNAVRRVRDAPEGTRNMTVNDQAFLVGQFVGGGQLDPRGVAEVLAAACTDPDRKKTWQTVNRGLRDGAAHPRRHE